MLLFSRKRNQSQRSQGTCSKPHSCSQPPGSQLSAHFAALWNRSGGGVLCRMIETSGFLGLIPNLAAS